ncbi:MAG: hypothetical protein IPK60_06925 [Sandaracinaceae bacterium]|jgi:hypothetical protein|nr:hypothetical protein [Sandaracinaceae bacterium]
MHRTLMIVVVFGMVSTAACGSDPVDVAGDYSLSLTNHENACMFPNWNENATTTGVQMTLTQNGSSVSATAGGLVAPALDIYLGSHVFTGELVGEHMDLHIAGTRAGSTGACAYTINANVSADIDGDVLTGTITYVAQHNNSADCGYLLTCANEQAFNGTRPPR